MGFSLFIMRLKYFFILCILSYDDAFDMSEYEIPGI